MYKCDIAYIVLRNKFNWKICLICILMVFLVGCASITKISVQGAIKKKKITKLETILKEIRNNGNHSYDQSISEIETYLSEYYLNKGNSEVKNGNFPDAINIFRKSIAYKETNSNSKSLNDIVQVKSEIDSLVHYFSSNDTINLIGRVNQLKIVSNASYPINKSSYLKREIDDQLINEYLVFVEIISDTAYNDYIKYLQLIDFIPPDYSFLRKKCNLYLNEYLKFIFYSENYINDIDRMNFLFLLSKSEDCPISEDERQVIVTNLKTYYETIYSPDFSELSDLYECYLVNSLIYDAYDLTIPIKNYVNDRSFIIVPEEDENRISKNITELLKFDKIIGNTINEQRAKIINISFEIDKLDININPETYSREIKSKYWVGSHAEPNSLYNYWSNEVSYYSAEYSRLINQPSYGGLAGVIQIKNIVDVRNILNNARHKLAGIPTTIEVQDYVEYRFTKKGHKIDSFLKIKLLIYYNNEIVQSIPIEANINKVTHSYIGVASNDYNGYKEQISLIPTEMILENMLIRTVSNKVKLELNNTERLSKCISSELLNINQIKESIPSLKSDEFADLFLKYSTSNDIQLEKISINQNKRSFSTIKEAVKFASKASCQIVAYDEKFSSASGTAFFISKDGFLITNQHVIGNKDNVLLLREANNEVNIKNAVLLYVDKTKDLALLKTQTPFDNSEFILINENIDIEMGDEIIYVGYPGSPITSGSEPFTSRGIISQIVKNEYKRPTLVLFDLTANPGSSGSAIIKEKTGELVGTMTWGFGRSITVNDIVDLIGGEAIRVKESQNVGTSVNVLMEFLMESGYYFED